MEDNVTRAAEIEAGRAHRCRETVKEKERRRKREINLAKEQLETNHTMSQINSQAFPPPIPQQQQHLLPINIETDFQYSFTNLAALEAFNQHSFLQSSLSAQTFPLSLPSLRNYI